MHPRSILLYEVLPQFEALADDGIFRVLGAFDGIETEANEYGQRAWESYVGSGSGTAELAEHAQNQGILYYEGLSNLRQGISNLLAVGLYHQFEQHRDRLEQVMKSQNCVWPDTTAFQCAAKIDELRLLANTVKHADGPSAAKLRVIRPDYFVYPIIREIGGNPPPIPLRNPLGGTDLFVGREDFPGYRDAIRSFWEELLPYL